MHGVFADVVRASETGEYCNGPMVLNDDEFVAVDRAKRLKAINQGIVQFVGQVHRVGSGNDCQEGGGHWTELKRGADYAATAAEELRGKRAVCDSSALCPRASKDAGQVKVAIMHWVEKGEENYDEARRRCEDSRSMETGARDVSQRCERSDADETGRGRRELRESQDEGDLLVDHQSSAHLETD